MRIQKIPTLVLKIGELTPKVGTISGAASIKALSEVKYTLDGNWSDKVDRWVIEGSNAARLLLMLLVLCLQK